MIAGRSCRSIIPLSGFFACLCAGLFILMVAVSSSVGESASDPEAVYTELVNSIMSPVCPGKILQACPSAEGAQLRQLVRRKAFEGETKEQIIRYFVEVYGPEVMPTPPAEGFFLTAWGLPFAAILAGIGVVMVLVRAWTAHPMRITPPPSSAGERSSLIDSNDALEKRLKRELEEFI